jgi:hypothetical protein
MLHENGVLLCADTEHESTPHKFYEKKLAHFQVDGGHVIFAYAGNASTAAAAIQKCGRKLQVANGEEPLTVIERTLDREYRKHVLSHPDYQINPMLHYQLLIGLSVHGQTELHATERTSIRRIRRYGAVGMGESLAHLLIRHSFVLGMPERRVLYLAACAMAAAKKTVTGCGGVSNFSSLRNDGTVVEFYNGDELYNEPGVHAIEEHREGFNFLAQNILMLHGDAGITDLDFEEVLADFSLQMQRLRQKAMGFTQRADQTADSEERPNPESTTSAPSDPPPSPE